MDYWPRLLQLNHAVAIPAIAKQVTAAAAVRDALSRHELPQTPLPRLGVTPGDYAQAILLGRDPAAIKALDAMLRNFRQYVAYHFGMWSFVTQHLFATWQQLFGPQRYLEVAAGNGYISAGLQAQGNQVITTDPLSWTGENVTGKDPLVVLQPLGATAALWTYGHAVDAVVMAWSPDHDLNDVQFLTTLRQHFSGLAFFVIGERNGATNSRLFWSQARFVADRRLLALNRALPQFDAINERIYLMR
ncbi:SAM-dependent methyltransferase [Lacticaseibacillus baoqingensis]|uniref:SAM-dependent methyltransferase n=1 Tax=Lacticaseibacillus baoqingensis TaxID=2486013 RepID=A0ABW4EA63_9LACO|nr:SAM-dependent methyltransferase [Lacticaseibacillus baoqingensis]